MTSGRNIEKGSQGADGIKSDDINPLQQNGMLNTPSILTGLSHEVRTYMNSIVAFTFLSNNDNCTVEQRDEYNRHIMDSCDQLITLFDNFLDSALIDSDIPRSTVTNCKLKELLTDLLDDINNSISRFDKKKITLLLDKRSGDDSIYIDKEKINRVLKNLFFNAFENTESGYIKLGYTRKKNRVEFYVIDSGNGYTKNRELLSCENITRYLGKHQNTFNTVSFILSRKLIESMNGELWIRPNEGNGTAMYFSVPEPNIMKEGNSEHITSRIAI
ncbi:MAG: HAMP domain-containing sensor histidine kinase [Bacteroidales bacterium]|nr:HAMP domain-containing sensor histidine kinase [Bacteroidales bacterium]